MVNIFSIGFTRKKARRFFELLIANNVELIIDVRLNNTSQLAGFSKGENLKYFLKKIANIEYDHSIIFAPSKELLEAYKKGHINWEEYEIEFEKLMIKREIRSYIESKGVSYWQQSCLLCSEESEQYCHRRLVINKIREVYQTLEIKHII